MELKLPLDIPFCTDGVLSCRKPRSAKFAMGRVPVEWGLRTILVESERGKARGERREAAERCARLIGSSCPMQKVCRGKSSRAEVFERQGVYKRGTV